MESDTAKDLRGSKFGYEAVKSAAALAAFIDVSLVILGVALLTVLMAGEAMTVGVNEMKSRDDCRLLRLSESEL